MLRGLCAETVKEIAEYKYKYYNKGKIHYKSTTRPRVAVGTISSGVSSNPDPVLRIGAKRGS